MVWMLAAVPSSSAMLLMRRYALARGLFQELNTAAIAEWSCWRGSSGMVCPASAMSFLNRVTTSARSSTVSWESSGTPRRARSSVRVCSKGSSSTPSTTSAYMWRKRR
jgi:hypothetical protein